MERRSTEAALSGLREYTDWLEAEIERLRADLVAVERTIQLLGDQQSGQPVSGVVDATYSSLRPQEATELLLRGNPGRRFRASDAVRELKRRGLRTKSKALASLITSALNRLAKKGVAEKLKVGGVNMYVLRQGRQTALGKAPVDESGPGASEGRNEHEGV